MPKSEAKLDKHLDLLARELLHFYDDFAALNACTAFVLEALAGAVVRGDAVGSRSAQGAMFCAQWLSDRTTEIERRLRKIQRRAHNVARPR